ncbi:retrovirus-related pol polyprotein LINE-1 [Tanacetum coccineum]
MPPHVSVGNDEVLNCYDAHREDNPHFWRRYWMLNPAMDHIVLVHYRDTTISSKNYATQLASSGGASEFDETYNSTPGPKIQKQLSLEHVKENGTFYNENEYPDDLGFTYNEQNYSGFEEFRYGSDNSVSLQYPGLSPFCVARGEHRVRSSMGNTEFFPVEVGLHQGSAISPYLFALIMDELSRGIQENIPWSMVFPDDIVLVAESADGLNKRLKSWRRALEDNGLRECWPITKAQANRVEVAELRMLRWTCGKTMLDMIPNGVFRAKLEVESIIHKMREGRLRWFGHVRRRPQTAPVRRVEALFVDGLRRRGRPKLRWEDRLKQDMKVLLLSEDMTERVER